MSVTAIVLAAGKSTRMGRQKLLLPYGGVPVVRHIVEVLREAGLLEIVVVTGRDADAVHGALEDGDVQFAHNADYETGMLSSVQAGMRAGEAASAYLVCLGDQPAIATGLVEALLERHKTNSDEILVPSFNGRRGHPLIVPSRFRDDVLSDRYAQQGLRGLLGEHQDDVHEFTVDADWVLRDMDTPEDYERELKLRASHDENG